VGFNHNAHDNLIWNYLYGWFAYSCDNLMIIESLNKERCQKTVPLSEPIGCMIISKDMKKIVVGSACMPIKKVAATSLHDSSSSKDKSTLEEAQFASIFILNHEFEIEKRLLFHPKGVQQLTFSENGKFLISVGNFKECSICVWDFPSGKLRASTYTLDKINDVKCMDDKGFEGRQL
jgi:WD40 repeat protein